MAKEIAGQSALYPGGYPGPGRRGKVRKDKVSHTPGMYAMLLNVQELEKPLEYFSTL